MTAPPPVAQMEDFEEGILEVEASDEIALRAIVESGKRGAELAEALSERFADPKARDIFVSELRSRAVGDGHSLIDRLRKSADVGKNSGAADMVRVLYLAVHDGLSEARLVPAIAAVTAAVRALLVYSPDPPVVIREPITAGTNPRVDPPVVPVTTPVAAPTPCPAVSPKQPASEPSSLTPPKASGVGTVAKALSRPIPPTPPKEAPVIGFRVPDRVWRPDPEHLEAPLFQKETAGGRGPGPVRAIAALLAPPRSENSALIRGWLHGEPAFPDAIGIRSGLLETGETGDLMEIESEFHTDPVAALRLYKARKPVEDGTRDAAWCARLGYGIGRYAFTHERAVDALARALSTYIDREGDWAAPLRRGGAILRVREELAEAVSALLDVEQEYLSDGPSETSGPPQNLLGAFSPRCSLSEGRCLDRALTLHLVADVPLGTAMRQSLSEFRLAQASRANPNAPLEELDRRFERDPALPFEELIGRVPIVRIGYTDPVLM